MMRQLRKHTGPALMAFLIVILGGWHFLETRAGAEAAGALWLCRNYLTLFACVLAFLAVLYVGMVAKRWPMEVCAVFSVLVLGAMNLVTLAPLSAPDEIAHFISSYEISNYMLGKPATDEEGCVMIRREDDFLQNIYGASGEEKRISLGATLDEEAYEILHARKAPVFVGAEGQEMTASVFHSVKTTPAAYLPQALGISLARLLHLNGVILAYMGRTFNLLFFAFLLYWSVRFLPTGKPVMLGVALLPMTLHVVASYSYDAFVIALSFFFASYCMNLAWCRPQVRKRDVALLSVVIAALGPCKIIYAVVMGFALLIPQKKFGTMKKWLLSAGVVFGAFVLSMALVNGAALAGIFSSVSSGAVLSGAQEAAAGAAAEAASIAVSNTGNFVEWAGEEGYSLGLLIHSPLRFVRVVYETLIHQADEWYLSMIGASLGNLDAVLCVPFLVVAALTVCLVLLSIRRAGESLYLSFGQKCWILLLAAASLFGAMMAMLLSWTPISSSMILGVQGRYLLPLLPFVLLTLKSERVVRTAGSDEQIIFYMCALEGYALLRLFSIVSMRL